jgi:hypothetical protein
MHNSCHGRWEGMAFEIICVCNCGHKLKAKSPIFAEESQYSVIGCPPRSEFCEAIQSKRQIEIDHFSCQGDRPTTMTRYLPFYRYKKHLGLDVNIKNARVRARAEDSCGCYDAIPCVVVGGREYVSCFYPCFGGSKTFDLGGEWG